MAFDIEAINIVVKNFVIDVRNKLSVYKAFLYGSYAKGTYNEYSDIDVCFFLNSFEGKSRHDIMVMLLGIAHKYIDFDIEPMVFHVSALEDDHPFVKEVLRADIEIQ
jgi:predicted nucleotidyltransferase